MQGQAIPPTLNSNRNRGGAGSYSFGLPRRFTPILTSPIDGGRDSVDTIHKLFKEGRWVFPRRPCKRYHPGIWRL